MATRHQNQVQPKLISNKGLGFGDDNNSDAAAAAADGGGGGGAVGDSFRLPGCQSVLI